MSRSQEHQKGKTSGCILSLSLYMLIVIGMSASSLLKPCMLATYMDFIHVQNMFLDFYLREIIDAFLDCKH